MKIGFRGGPPFPSTVLSDASPAANGITEHWSPYVDNKVERCLVDGRLVAAVVVSGLTATAAHRGMRLRTILEGISR